MAEPNKPAPPRVVCTCISFKCQQGAYTDKFGEQQSGKLVAKSTRNNHRKRDRDQDRALDNETPAAVQVWYHLRTHE